VILLAASADGLTTSGAQAQKLEARYAISMTGIRVGQSAWTVRIEADRYSASATGGSVDLMNVLVRGEGSARVSGSIKDGRLVPAEFSSKLVEEGEKSDLKMTFEEGVVTAVEARKAATAPFPSSMDAGAMISCCHSSGSRTYATSSSPGACWCAT